MNTETTHHTSSSIRLIRHATLLIELNGQRILLDPMLGAKDSMAPVPNVTNTIRIPMVELPFDEAELEKLIEEVDAVFVTHTHPDHWDPTAIEIIPKDKPLFVQPADTELITGQGFTNVTTINDSIVWQDISITRTGGQHGTGEIGKLMGTVSGFVFKTDNTPTIYVAGDTIWCEEVEEALKVHKPQITVVNAGAAQFAVGDPITMTADDVKTVAQTDADMKVVAVHMDTINHCFLTRKLLGEFTSTNGLQKQVLIPDDGQTLSL